MIGGKADRKEVGKSVGVALCAKHHLRTFKLKTLDDMTSFLFLLCILTKRFAFILSLLRIYLYCIPFHHMQCAFFSVKTIHLIQYDVNKNQTGTGRLECLFADNKSSHPKRKPTFCISIRVRRTLHCTCEHLAAVGQSTTMCILTPRLCYFLQ